MTGWRFFSSQPLRPKTAVVMLNMGGPEKVEDTGELISLLSLCMRCFVFSVVGFAGYPLNVIVSFCSGRSFLGKTVYGRGNH